MRALLRSAAFTALFLCAAHAAAQVESQLPARPGRQLPFYFDALNFAQPDAYGLLSRLDIYVQVPFDIITFVKKSDGYAGAYTITALVSDDDGNRVKEESWTRKVERTSFESATDPGTSDLTQRAITLDPGAYIVEVIFEDKESSTEFRNTKKVEARRFDQNLFGMSDMMLVGAVDESGGKRRITPQLNPNIAGLQDGFSLFYEVYNPFTMPDAVISYRITKRKVDVVSTSGRQALKQGVNSFLTHVQTKQLGVGSYDIELTVSRADDSTRTGILAQSTRAFVVEWLSGGTPLSISDLDEAIDQLRYFAKGEELDFIREAPDDTEKRIRFEAFWSKHNPVPGAPTNRAMVEYYTRVAYANERFGHYLPGWKTDRGMVYIIYGGPSAVDRHPLDVESKPYEIWEYYDINRRFVFMDDSGFGDYRLLYPIWDDRNRMR